MVRRLALASVATYQAPPGRASPAQASFVNADAANPEQGAVIKQAWDLITFARKHGYQIDELVAIIQDAG
jgi:hypothetical protein